MKCILCGKEVPEGQLFCQECKDEPAKTLGGDTADLPDASALKDIAVIMHGDEGGEADEDEALDEYFDFDEYRPKTGKGFVIASFALAALCLALLAIMLVNNSSLAVRKNQLVTAEALADEKIQLVQSVERDLEQKAIELEAAEDRIARLELELEGLKHELLSHENTSTQSQFDRTLQENEIERLSEELTTVRENFRKKEAELMTDIETKEQELQLLTIEVTEKEADLLKVKSELESAKSIAAAASDKVKFVDNYVVFIEDDGTKLYHKFECSRFKRQSFWVYNTVLAKSNGYSPCPLCIGD